MIKATDFLGQALKYGFSFYSGVPCSYLEPLIKSVIKDVRLTYITASNEAHAIAVCSGAVIAGERAVVTMQNSGLGNAVNPLTSLNHIFRIPVLLLVSWRGAPGIPDEPQHILMGSITTEMLELMQIPWEFLPDQEDKLDEAIKRAVAYMEEERRPYALVVRKSTFISEEIALSENEKISVDREGDIGDLRENVSKLFDRLQMLQCIVEYTPLHETVVVATTGYTGRELYTVADRANQLYMVGSMGCAFPFALGIAMNRRDRKIIVLDGDGALLMHLGAMAMVGPYSQGNLIHIIFDNGVYLSTGGQSTLACTVDFCRVALACGYKHVFAVNTVEGLKKAMGSQSALGDSFVYVEVNTNFPPGLPRPKISPEEVAVRLQKNLRDTEKIKR